MNKFIIILLLYLVVLLNIQIKGKMVEVGLKIKEDWEEKREFIYLKNIQIKERFVLIMNVKHGNKIENYFNNRTESFCKIEVDPVNKVRLNNNFKKNNNCYETSILETSLENKKELLKENIENYKNKLLSSYWTEINLIGYKIELLEKQKVEYPKELERKIIDIGNKISGIIEVNKRKCFNCSVTQTKQWSNLLKEHYLCNECNAYKHKYGKFRSNQLWFKTKKCDRKCFICGVIQTICWRRQPETGNYLCNACGCKLRKEETKKRNTKI
uniref:GATA-type domain-containing protein n=1 Tax=Meloidogyne enterolobii TaxID=390850 RepID=A0A6V7WSU6_MELEN|nr:unnamed protein product [Meloidogyne enterolobii]